MKLFSLLHLQTCQKDKKNGRSRCKIFDKSGISIAEVVIAMAVITIVSVAALTAIKSASTGLIKDMAMVEINTDASNAIEFFKYADTLSTLDGRIRGLGAGTSGNQDTDGTEAGTKTRTYTIQKSVYTLTIAVEYNPAAEDGGNGNNDYSSTPLSICVFCVDTENNSYFDVRYEK